MTDGFDLKMFLYFIFSVIICKKVKWKARWTNTNAVFACLLGLSARFVVPLRLIFFFFSLPSHHFICTGRNANVCSHRLILSFRLSLAVAVCVTNGTGNSNPVVRCSIYYHIPFGCSICALPFFSFFFALARPTCAYEEIEPCDGCCRFCCIAGCLLYIFAVVSVLCI